MSFQKGKKSYVISYLSRIPILFTVTEENQLGEYIQKVFGQHNIPAFNCGRYILVFGRCILVILGRAKAIPASYNTIFLVILKVQCSPQYILQTFSFFVFFFFSSTMLFQPEIKIKFCYCTKLDILGALIDKYLMTILMKVPVKIPCSRIWYVLPFYFPAREKIVRPQWKFKHTRGEEMLLPTSYMSNLYYLWNQNIFFQEIISDSIQILKRWLTMLV